jgi:hypothetical protein
MNHRAILALTLGALSFAAIAQTESPYIGQEARDIKSLSQQEIDAYLQGSGMGYAKAAELNHYPGPLHVLELAQDLELSAEQVERTEAIFASMKQRATTLGAQIVEREAELDQEFASGSIDGAVLKAMLSEIGTLESELRFAHLLAHIEGRAVLSRHQIRQYDALRGYGTSGHEGRDHSH